MFDQLLTVKGDLNSLEPSASTVDFWLLERALLGATTGMVG